MSASSICSAKSAVIRSAPSSVPPLPRGVCTSLAKSSAKEALSTKAMDCAMWAGGFARPSSTVRVARGSATPLNSTMMASKAGSEPEPFLSEANSRMLWRRSSEAVQQTQPFASSMLRASAFCAAVSSTRASTFTAAKSLTIIPMRKPWSSSKMCFNSVVLPAPRKPERITTGMPSRTSLQFAKAVPINLDSHGATKGEIRDNERLHPEEARDANCKCEAKEPALTLA
mmetsp:Transcript_107510/g.302602  ORF Transcript_107510/g.302602 Transcript_107510/m.302602 type:complete len:228 (+) Transcript_107510:1106-1789(+)